MECQCPQSPVASRTGEKGMCREPFSACQKHLQDHQLCLRQFFIPHTACQTDPLHRCPCLGQTRPAMALPCLSPSPVLHSVLSLTTKPLLTDVQMVCISSSSQGTREMSPAHGACPLPSSPSLPTSIPGDAVSAQPPSPPRCPTRRIAPSHSRAPLSLKRHAAAPASFVFSRWFPSKLAVGY